MNVSVLIVSHNTRSDLQRCLESLLHTGARPRDIWVADNASTDGSRELLEQAQFAGIRVQAHNRNLYYAAAVNRLAADADGDFLLLLNPDTEPNFEALLRLLTHFEADAQCVAVAPQLRAPDGHIQASCRRLPDAWTPWREFVRALGGRGSHWKMADFDHASERYVEQPMFSCIWISRRAWIDVGGLDEAYPLFFNDVDWCSRAREQGGRIRFDPSVAVPHGLGGTTRRYPWRRHWYAHAGFARYVCGLRSSFAGRCAGLAGVVMWFVLRFPGAFLTRR